MITSDGSTPAYNNGLRCDGGYSASTCTYGTVAGMALRATTSALWMNGGGDHWRIIANDLSCPNGDGQQGCFTTNEISNVLFYGNYSHDNSSVLGTSSKQFHSVYFSTDSNHITVGWNKCLNNFTCRALQFHSSPLGNGPGDPTGFQQFDLHVHDNFFDGDRCNGINFATIDPSKGPVEAYNNLIINVGRGPDSTEGGSEAYGAIYMPNYTPNQGQQPGTGTVLIYNNTIWNSGNFSFLGTPGGAFENDATTNMTMNLRNNIVYSAVAATEYINPSNTGAITGSNNVWFGSSSAAPTQTTGNITSDPLFVNIGNKDFHLQSGSPAKDAGLTISGLIMDLDGISRPQGPAYDIGAYEFH
jgi:hypothetical protein